MTCPRSNIDFAACVCMRYCHIIVRCCSPCVYVLPREDSHRRSHAVHQQLPIGAGGSHVGPDDPMFAGVVHSRPGRMSGNPPGARFDPIGTGLALKRKVPRSSSCFQTSIPQVNTVIWCQIMFSQHVHVPLQHQTACLDHTPMTLWDQGKWMVGMILDLHQAVVCLTDGALGRIHSVGSCDSISQLPGPEHSIRSKPVLLCRLSTLQFMYSCKN